MKSLEQLVRPNIWALKPYSCARDEYKGKNASVFLDANENPYNNPLNRYPDPLQEDLKKQIAHIKGVVPEKIFLGNGSDEAIDLAYRIFCIPGRDNAVSIAPSYGMYKVCADINNVEFRTVELEEDFSLNAEKLLNAVSVNTKMIFLCSPNNPSGNSLDKAEIEKILLQFDGIVILDEAYSDFSAQESFRHRLEEFPNIIILNTMSKAWGCAAIRLGMAFASEQIIALFNKVKYPYNVNLLTQKKAMEMLQRPGDVERWVNTILNERESLMEAFAYLPCCEEVYPTDANFFLAKMTDATQIYNYLVNCGVVTRNRTTQPLCRNCIRITIGTPDENNALLAALRKYKN
ncbi:MAG TPA: histidinol-phosphate transaminase [Prevotellaceae bacterium]|jgi:histidinol-phosphate aminotransferase|nr:histidinol-phosphate transaminase [Prevotellaceae bacterium]